MKRLYYFLLNQWFLVICFSTMLYVFPLYATSVIHDTTWRLDSDYDSVWSGVEYTIRYIRQYYTFPVIHEFAGFGIPLSSDPTFPLFHPLVFIPMVLLGFEKGMWVVIALSVGISGVSMYVLLHSLTSRKNLVLWGSLLYMFSGALAARIAAGHISYIISYPLWPLFFYFILQPFPSFFMTMLYALTYAFFFLSGDIYGCIYATFFFLCSRVAYLYTHQKHIGAQLRFLILFSIGSLLFAAIKILPMTQHLDVLMQMTRYFQPIFGQGSIHLPFTILPFIVPWRVAFYDDNVFFRYHLGLWFNWYEYYAYLTPLPLLFLFRFPWIHHTAKKMLLGIFIIGMVFISQKFPYSPFYWLLKDSFLSAIIRVPQRMYVPMTSILIALVVLCTPTIPPWRTLAGKCLYVLLIGSLCWTYMVNIQTMNTGLEKQRTAEFALVNSLKAYDAGTYFILDLICCTQHFLIDQQIHVLNFYAGWQSKKTPSFIDPVTQHFTPEKLTTIRPKYILAAPTETFYSYNYRPVIIQPIGTIWETDSVTISPN